MNLREHPAYKCAFLKTTIDSAWKILSKIDVPLDEPERSYLRIAKDDLKHAMDHIREIEMGEL